jgi:hypothetical protein
MLSRCSKHRSMRRLIALITPTRACMAVVAFGGADQATDRCLPFLIPAQPSAGL